ncbi:hypothetical protein [Kineosporia sp. NBRC 101731]|uniref:hypothetical protein n=1 Tax=Kineosporia sp. NBRC 101731 TaxID=3032199 RepID=UPI0024A56870|nr:hypothetical protein [Kineosporia sp. NBRC 101731]GLY29690.1 hypothetical protein Kisp02_30550 [Kineosporia sp. NBRC 101731]
MTGVATHLAIADLVLQARRAGGEPVLADSELPFYRLGAIAPLLGDFLPTRAEAPDTDNAALFQVWAPILDLLAGVPGAPPTPGLVENLLKIKDALRRFQEAVVAQDKFALLGMKDELLALSDTVNALTAQVAGINGLRSRVVRAVAQAAPVVKDPPAQNWPPRQVLKGHRPGRFWTQLRRRCAASPDPRLQAFALGIPVAIATTLAASSFVNGVTGGPDRNHWWRHRWISQYVDAWAWGYVATRSDLRAGGEEIVFELQNRLPRPRYRAWKDIAGAELQDLIGIGGITHTAVLDALRDDVALPAFLPSELVDAWVEGYRDVVGAPVPSVDAGALHGAYALTWLTTWIASSGQLLGTTAPDRINEPDACGDRPAWAAPDGSVVVGGTLYTPPQVEQPGPSAGEIASAIIAAILGLAAFATGNVAGGFGAIAAAVLLIDDATDPDWHALRCHAGWLQVFVAHLDIAFRDLLSTTALAPPWAVQLEHNEIQFVATGSVEPTTAALNTCRSPHPAEEAYPASVWRPAPGDSNWTAYPNQAPESPPQTSYAEGSWWPSHFIDGRRFTDNGPTAVPRYSSQQDNPVATSPTGTASVLDQNLWDQRMAAAANLAPFGFAGFGNALDVALTLQSRPDEPLPDWDLDADRGQGWPAWSHVPGAGPGVVTRD